MTCEHVTASLHDYTAHTLSPTERVRVDEHLLTCPSCARLAGEYEAVVRAAHTLTPPPVPVDVEQRLLQALARAVRTQADRPSATPGDATAPPT